MRRPGLWVAVGQPANISTMYGWKPGAVACFYEHLQANDVYNYKKSNPAAPIVVRFQHPRDWHEDPEASAVALGRFVAGKWRELQPLDPYVYFASRLNMHYENGDPDPKNQPLYTTPEFYERYAKWVHITADVIKDTAPEMKLITPPFAFGYNEDGSPTMDGNPTKGWAGYDFLQQTIQDYFDNIITFHGFWGYPGGGSIADWLYEPELASWYAFRWQRILKLFEARYNIQAKLFIDAAGNFSPSDSDFSDQLIYYARQCLSDVRVIGLTYFLWSDSTKSSLYQPNTWVDNVQNLARHLNRLKYLPDIGIGDTPSILNEFTATEPQPAPASTTTERTIRVLFEDGTVQIINLEEYLRAVVPGEVPATWPGEAVKAQAIVARGYAQYAIEHPRHAPHADVCTTTHCQYYNPSKIHPVSDEAIQKTRGIIALYQGQTANTVFSARCGGHTQNNEDVWRGAPVPYMRGVPCPDKGEKHGHGIGLCQHGARVFAAQGRTCEDIVKHFYQGVTLGPIKG